MLAAVVAVAETGTLERAAEQLGLATPSAVHKRIKAASRLFGRELFLHTNEGMVLTPAGEILYPEASRTIEQALLAEEKTRAQLELEAGRLIVGHSTHLPPRLLAAVMKLKFDDGLGIHIEHRAGVSSTIAQQVIEGTAHAGFGYLPMGYPDLLTRTLYEEPLVVCMAKEHRLASKAVLRPQDLDGEAIIAVARGLPALHREIEEFFAGFGIELEVAADAFGPSEAVTMAEQGMGVCLIEGSAIRHPTVIGKPMSPQVLTRKSGLYIREDNRHPILLAFVELVLKKTVGRFKHR